MEEEIKKYFCKYCKKNKCQQKDCLILFLEIDGQIKTYGCANYESTLEKRDLFYVRERARLHELKVQDIKRRMKGAYRKKYGRKSTNKWN